MYLRQFVSIALLAATPAMASAADVSSDTQGALRILVSRARPSIPSIGDGAEVRRAGDGLFYVDAVVNGTIVHFLVDTGATSIVLTPDDAQRAGIAVGAPVHLADTANGRTAFTHVTLSELTVGGVADRQVPALVASDRLPVSLLGQSWLQHLASVTIMGDRMVLR